MYYSKTDKIKALRCQHPEHGVFSILLSQLERCVSLLIG